MVPRCRRRRQHGGHDAGLHPTPGSSPIAPTVMMRTRTCIRAPATCVAKIAPRRQPGAPSTWFRDEDGDGYGNAAITSQNCNLPSGSVAIAGDCDDSNSSVHPGAADCANAPDGVDNDCNGLVDDVQNCQPPPDQDRDGDGVNDDLDACPDVPGTCPDGCPPSPVGLCPATACGLIGLSIIGLIQTRG